MPARIEALALNSWLAGDGPGGLTAGAAAAARSALCGVADIDAMQLCLFCGTYHSDTIREPAVAAQILSRLGASHGAAASPPGVLAFDVDSGAAGFAAGVRIAAAYLEGGGVEKVLIVCGDGLPAPVTGGVLEIPRVAAAAVLSNDTRGGFGAWSQFTFPRYELSYAAIGIWNSPDGPGCHAGHRIELSADPRLRDLALDCAVAAVERHLLDKGLQQHRLLGVVAADWPPGLACRLADRLGLPPASPEPMVEAGANYQSCAGAMAMAKAIVRHKEGPPGDLLFVSCGPGFTVFCVSYRFAAGCERVICTG